MLNRGSISYVSNKHAIIALSLIKTEYVAFNLAAWEVTWLRLLVTELGLLKPHNQFIDIYINKNNKCAKVILSLNSTLYPERILD